jgi:hypothetical protein
MLSPRTVLGIAGAGLFAVPDRLPGLRIGVTGWNLQQAGKVDAVALAAKLGFDGVEISLGSTSAEGKLPLHGDAVQQRYLDALKDQGSAAPRTCLDILHIDYLKSAKLGQKWIEDGFVSPGGRTLASCCCPSSVRPC